MSTILKVSVQLSAYILVTILLLDLCTTTPLSVKQSASSIDKINHRSRRQTGDIVLIGLKAKSALKGTTKPSDFYRRIGKKRSQSNTFGRLREEYQPFREYDDIFTV